MYEYTVVRIIQGGKLVVLVIPSIGILKQISFWHFQIKRPHFFFHCVFPHIGLQSELYDVSKAVADSKQVDVKLASFKASCLPPISTIDTSFLYVNQASSGGELMLWQYKLQYLEYLIPLRNIGFR